MSGKVTMCAVGLALAVCDAKAEPVLFQFSGEVERIEVPEEGHALSGAIVVGTTFSGTYTIESTTPDSSPYPGLGDYYGAIDNLSGAIHGELGDVSFQGPVIVDQLGQESNYVEVHMLGWDSEWWGHSFRAGVDVLGSPFRLYWGYNPWSWNSEYPRINAIPINPPPFEDLHFFSTSFSYTELDPVSGEPASFRGRLTSLHVVPEPTTGMLLLAAGGLLLARRRRRS